MQSQSRPGFQLTCNAETKVACVLESNGSATLYALPQILPYQEDSLVMRRDEPYEEMVRRAITFRRICQGRTTRHIFFMTMKDAFSFAAEFELTDRDDPLEFFKDLPIVRSEWELIPRTTTRPTSPSDA